MTLKKNQVQSDRRLLGFGIQKDPTIDNEILVWNNLLNQWDIKTISEILSVPEIFTNNPVTPNVIPNLIFTPSSDFIKFILSHTGFRLGGAGQTVIVNWEIRQTSDNFLVTSFTTQLFVNPDATHLPFLAKVSFTNLKKSIEYKMIFVSITGQGTLDINDKIFLSLF